MDKNSINRLFDSNNDDGIDRREFLKCMAWAGTGVLWVISGGVAKAVGLSQILNKDTGQLKSGIQIPTGELSFVQISDSHIGFNKAANPDVVGTLLAAISKINVLPEPPSFILHTGDLTHLSKPDEFDTLQQVLKSIRTDEIFYVPGEHDFLDDTGRQYLDRFGKGTEGSGWYSFDKGGTHFVGLVNVINLKAGGLGNLGEEQLKWLKDNLSGISSSTPVVVFAHIPLWNIYPQWGWGTDDSAEALSYLKRFGSVTVLNGHIHQNIQKIEGNMTFHTAMSTAFPQPAPGAAASPGPMTVPAEKLRTLLGLTSVNYAEHNHSLAITDMPLIISPSAVENKSQDNSPSQNQILIENFSFTPAEITVTAGTTITWINHDDAPHQVKSSTDLFRSPAMDTDDQFSFTFTGTGTYEYFCSLHPRMTGKVIVK